MSNQTTPISTPDLFPAKPKPRTVYQVMWRLNKYHWAGSLDAMWTAMEEDWSSQESAEARLKHYQKSTLSRVLEFRVEPGQIEVK